MLTLYSTSKQKGFTIVELLIVVVVIAILATISIVAYNGITTKAEESKIKSELNTGAKLVELHKANSGNYPSSVDEVNNGKGVGASEETGLSYSSSNGTYCLSAESLRTPSISFYVTQDGKIQSGQCAFIAACYNFNAATHTLEDYYYNEYNNNSNPECPDRIASIPSHINGVEVRVLGHTLYYGWAFVNDHATIPSTVTTIGPGAFSESYLKSITIPDSVTRIENSAFAWSNDIDTIYIPDSVTFIGDEAFRESYVSNLRLPNNPATVYGNSVFSFNGIRSITFPASMTTIPVGFFASNYIETLTIPNHITQIGVGAFSENYTLTSVTIPNSVTSIGAGAFEYTGLTTVSVPSATYVHPSAFDSGVTINRY